MTSMPALPNVLNRSSSSSEEVISAGSSSLTSSYSRYPFSLPMLISCRTSSYFSSSAVFNVVLYSLRQSFNLLSQMMLLVEQGIDRLAVFGRSQSLQTVDFTLDGRALALPAQPFQAARAVSQPPIIYERRGLPAGNSCDELNVHCT